MSIYDVLHRFNFSSAKWTFRTFIRVGHYLIMAIMTPHMFIRVRKS